MIEFLPITPPNHTTAQAVSRALGAHPRGHSFGRLTEAAVWLSACQNATPARQVEHPCVVIVVGHHGIAERGLSAFTPAATNEQAAQLADAVSPTHCLARRVHARVEVVDTVASGAIDIENALSSQQLEDAVRAGQEAADRAIDAGADLLIPADLGVGNTTVAAALMGHLSNTEPVAVIGSGSGITNATWKNKVTVIRDAMFRARHLTDPLELVQVCGGSDVAALIGFITQAAARRTPLLIDSPLTAVSTVLAERLARGSAEWIYAASATDEPAHRLALQDLGLLPLLDIRITTGQAVGSLAAVEIIGTGVELAADEFAAWEAAMHKAAAEKTAAE